MFPKYHEHVKKVLISAKEEMLKLKHAYVGTEHVLLAILKNTNYLITKQFNKYDINYNNYKKKLIDEIGYGKNVSKYFVYTPFLKHVIDEAEILAKNQGEECVLLEHIITIIFNENEGVAVSVLMSMNINIEALSKEFCIKKSKKPLRKKIMIEEYGYNINAKVYSEEIDPLIGREKEIQRIIEILCRRRKSNPLLIGEAGVGKTAIVEELSRKIVEESVPECLKSKKIISISMACLIAGTKYRGEFEERITKLLKEIESTDEIILFVDEIHTLVGAGGAEGAIDASNILKPFLARGKVKVIGATTIHEYKKYIEIDKALERRFQKVLIDEPNEDEVFQILKKISPIYEKYHNVSVSNKVLKQIVLLSNKYIYDNKQPDKAIDILDESASKTALKKNNNTFKLENLKKELNDILLEKKKNILKHNFNKAAQFKEKELELKTSINYLICKKNNHKRRKEVTLKTVANVVKSKTNIPIYEYIPEDFSKLKNMEKNLLNKIIGQNIIIREICKDIKRIKLGYKFDNKPISYLFVGPTGVGKTDLAKELSKYISGTNKLIRLDMSEYKEEYSISKIIGSPPGYVGFSDKKTILEMVKTNPNAIILLDEIERAHISVINLFFQVLDEGSIKSSSNEIVRFDNNIIIMTSNIGCSKLSMGFNKNYKVDVTNKLKETLGVEFINRISSIFAFNRLSEEDIKKIIKEKEKKLVAKISDKKKKIKLSQKDIDNVVKKSEYFEYGARKIEKIITDILIEKAFKEKIKDNVKLTIETT